MIPSLSQDLWRSPPAFLQLAENVIHLWYAPLEQPKSVVEQLYQTLSTEERARAKRFYFERDRQHFIVGRAVLRNVLGRYISLEPQHLQFCYGAHGKPALLQLRGNDILHFNVSHSNGIALYAIALNRELGVDVEYIRYLADADQIADSFFSLSERKALRSLTTEDVRIEAFFCCWTRKEAYVKALGNGLSQPLDQFDVSLLPGDDAELLAVQGKPEEIQRWKLHAISLPSPYERQYKAALVVECNPSKEALPIQAWQWQAEGE
ncbi:4'-phosphopantetheinyl transferase family protein [Dictyobacter arantiisoli]|uniref:4'-phosphopantetheinyl transferase n=1 Tax=Dictyobacter arantiisoli TaxID=2014874 RepID=A0A5A5T7A0_9CHLR|nr:4'-phosphopantetheinyl transferase superfamily protein [Dictyobacter arantiisoli]GCF07277.1 4'-phosphopantetheinyl transferase [Dictyobacter arantiisoli]